MSNNLFVEKLYTYPTKCTKKKGKEIGYPRFEKCIIVTSYFYWKTTDQSFFSNIDLVLTLLGASETGSVPARIATADRRKTTNAKIAGRTRAKRTRNGEQEIGTAVAENGRRKTSRGTEEKSTR